MTKQHNLETLIMAHRYLYYVGSDNVISDYEYDRLESKARQELPETSPVHGVGSSLSSDYTEAHITLAKELQASR